MVLAVGGVLAFATGSDGVAKGMATLVGFGTLRDISLAGIITLPGDALVGMAAFARVRLAGAG